MRCPVNLAALDRWLRAGVIHLPRPGTGYRRHYPPAELRAIHAVHAAVGSSSGAWTPQRRTLLVAIAAAARSNPPGSVVELPSPVSYVRHVLVVPSP